MNYFELHIGDYDKATAHLTATEDGIYGRLLRRYYDTEAPLPADLKAVQRLVRARAKDEKEAVETMLEEFFELSTDGWHHKRCDEEIERYQAKRAKAQASANARWGRQQEASERNANASGESDANASSDAMRTHSDGNARQSPVTSITPEDLQSAERSLSPRAALTPIDPSAAGRACLAMRKAGLTQTNPSHPSLLAALAEGAIDADFEHTAREALTHQPSKGFAWVIATVRGRLADAKPGASSHAPRSSSGRGSLADQVRKPESQPDAGSAGTVIEGSAVRVPHR